ncbi:MAG: hypothetical protein ACRCWO_02060 [Bosea sp. (in: a-proteobacteria)]
MALKSSNSLTIISLAILVGTEVMAVALASAWALGGLFELGPTITYVMMGLFSGAGLYMMVRFVQQAMRVEPLHD